MKLQVTKDKSIDINLFGPREKKSAGEAAPLRDVTAVELRDDGGRGYPAVRMTAGHGGVPIVKAVAHVPPPVEGRPWALPGAFRSSAAVIVLPGEQTGAKLAAYFDGENPEVETKGINRQAFSVMASSDMKLEVTAPEELAAKAAALLPEGARPTAVALQVAHASSLGTVTLQREFGDERGTLAILALHDAIRIAGFQGTELVLLRTIDGIAGTVDLAASAEHATDYELAVRGVMRQVALSRDYLERRGRSALDAILLVGDVPLRESWASQCKAVVGLRLQPCDPFGDAQSGGISSVPEGDFTASVGAAAIALGKGDGTGRLNANLIKPEELRSSSPVRWQKIGLWTSLAALLAVLGWWGLVFANLQVAKEELSVQLAQRDELRPQWAAFQEQKKVAQDCRGHLEEYAAFAMSRHVYGLLLAHLAESVPYEMQLVSMAIPLHERNPMAVQQMGPDGQPVPPPPPPKVEPATIRLLGRAPLEKTVESFMKTLVAADFGGELVVDEKPAAGEQPSPKIHSFRQVGVSDDGGFGTRREQTLEFDVEFRLKGREFRK